MKLTTDGPPRSSPDLSTQQGRVHDHLIASLRTSWRLEGLSRESATRQRQAVDLIFWTVERDVKVAADRVATRDAIRRELYSW